MSSKAKYISCDSLFYIYADLGEDGKVLFGEEACRVAGEQVLEEEQDLSHLQLRHHQDRLTALVVRT
jgi:hypothetical protein